MCRTCETRSERKRGRTGGREDEGDTNEEGLTERGVKGRRGEQKRGRRKGRKTTEGQFC